MTPPPSLQISAGDRCRCHKEVKMLVRSLAQRPYPGVRLLLLTPVIWSLAHSSTTLAQSDDALLRPAPRGAPCELRRRRDDWKDTAARQARGQHCRQRNLPRESHRFDGSRDARRARRRGPHGGGGVPAELTGLVTIDGARGVTVTGFTIQNGPGDGILALHAATFAVRNTTVQDHAFIGIEYRSLNSRTDRCHDATKSAGH